MLLLTLDTQRKMRHAATDGQFGIDEIPHLEGTWSQSLCREGIKPLEPIERKDANEGQDRAYETIWAFAHTRGVGRTGSRCSKDLQF